MSEQGFQNFRMEVRLNLLLRELSFGHLNPFWDLVLVLFANTESIVRPIFYLIFANIYVNDCNVNATRE